VIGRRFPSDVNYFVRLIVLCSIVGVVGAPTQQTPAATPPAAPTPPVTSRPAADKNLPQERKIALAPLWDSKMQGGSETMRDLQRLFAPHARPSADLSAGAQLMMADEIPYLCPLPLAEERLHVAGKVATKNLISCPGFPRGSIYYRSYDGQFEGHYNRMYIVVDAADQLVSVQLVDEIPKPALHMHWEKHWFCYNFVSYRVKTVSRLQIAHEVKEVRRDVLRVDSGLHDPGFNKPRRAEPRTLEASRWYIPRPFVQLILHCISKAS
jgi:hypothetical protein